MTNIEEVIDAVPPDRATATAKAMLKHGVKDGDPLVEVISIALDADEARRAAGEAAQATGAAAQAVSAETAKIPDAIYQGTIRAGADLKSQVAAAGQEVLKAATDQAAKVQTALTAAVAQAAQAGASVLGKAVQGMDANAKASIDEIIARGVLEVSAAVRADARAAVAGRMARSWGAVAALLTFFMVLGGTIAWGGLYATHHITPMNMPIATNNQGHRLCGHLRGSEAEACLVGQQ